MSAEARAVCAQSPASTAAEETWPASRCLLTAAFRPAATAMRTNHIPLRAAWRLHLLAATIVLLELLIMGGFLETHELTVAGVLSGVYKVLLEILEEISHAPNEALAAITLSILGIELGLVVLGLVLAPWGARVEQFRTSIAHGIRRVWLQTPHVIWVIALVAPPGVFLARVNISWHRQHPFPITAYSPPANATSAELQAYNEEWQGRYERWRASRPFWVRYDEEIIVCASFATGLWFFWALLRAVGAPRTGEQLTQPPSCEFCGYNLSTMAMEARCPECGQPVIESLGPQVRPGTPWQQRDRIGRLRGYVASVFGAAFRPAAFGRTLRIYTPGRDHRTFLAVHAILVGVISMPGLILLAVSADGWEANKREPTLWLVFFLVASVIGVAAILIMLLLAGIVGLDRRVRDGRNLLVAAVQGASYLSPLWLVGTVFAWLTGAAAVTQPHVIRNWAFELQIDDEFLLLVMWAGLNLLWVVIWFVTLWRITAAARYANR